MKDKKRFFRFSLSEIDTRYNKQSWYWFRVNLQMGEEQTGRGRIQTQNSSTNKRKQIVTIWNPKNKKKEGQADREADGKSTSDNT